MKKKLCRDGGYLHKDNIKKIIDELSGAQFTGRSS